MARGASDVAERFDRAEPAPTKGGPVRRWRGPLHALRFLTALPLGRSPAPAAEVAAGQAFFPLVGLLIGLGAAGLDRALLAFLPPPVASALLLLALTLVSGGLHLDGLMDTCDGLFHHSEPERRLAIMRDSRVGAYGVIGLALDLLVKYALLVWLPGPLRGSGLVLGLTLAYWAMALAIFAFPPARSEGLGAAFKAAATPGRLLGAALIAAAVCAAAGNGLGLVLALGVSGVVLLAGLYAKNRLGGLTGDVYGALHELALLVGLMGWPLLHGGYPG